MHLRMQAVLAPYQWSGNYHNLQINRSQNNNRKKKKIQTALFQQSTVQNLLRWTLRFANKQLLTQSSPPQLSSLMLVLFMKTHSLVMESLEFRLKRLSREENWQTLLKKIKNSALQKAFVLIKPLNNTYWFSFVGLYVVDKH